MAVWRDFAGVTAICCAGQTSLAPVESPTAWAMIGSAESPEPAAAFPQGGPFTLVDFCLSSLPSPHTLYYPCYIRFPVHVRYRSIHPATLYHTHSLLRSVFIFPMRTFTYLRLNDFSRCPSLILDLYYVYLIVGIYQILLCLCLTPAGTL